MKFKILFTVIACWSIGQLHASKDSTKSRITDAYLLGGAYFSPNQEISLDQMKAYNPSSLLLNTNFSGYERGQLTIYNQSAMFQMAIGIKVKENGPSLRAGLVVGSGPYISGSYYRTDSKHVDTLVSSSSGKIYYIDSFTSQSYLIRTKSDMIQLDFSLLWRSKNRHKFTVFGGIGAYGGTSLNVFTTIEYYKYDYVNEPNHYRYAYNMHSGLQNSESFKNPNHQVFGVYVPFGLDYKMSKRPNFFSNFHLIFESRVRLQYYNFQGVSSYYSVPFNALFGIRYKFNP